MSKASPEQVAAWLAEALETGNPLAPLPEGTEPTGAADSERVAALVLESLGLVPCGLRLTPGPTGEMIAGPVLHPILDVSAWRLREPPASVGLAVADLAGHGFIVTGRGKRGMAAASLPVGMAPAGARRRPEARDVAAALLAAAE